MSDFFETEEISGGECICGSGSYNKAALKGCGSYNKAALRGCGSYNKAALRGCGSYNKAALKGCGSYNKAALRGCGRGSGRTYDEDAVKASDDDIRNILSGGRVIKGSAEAKARMAVLRSLRTGKRRSKVAGRGLGSNPLWRNPNLCNMTLERAKRAAKLRGQTSGGIIQKLLPLYKEGVGKWASRIFSDKSAQEKRIAELEKLVAEKRARKSSGGKFEGRDIVDFFAGPIGWVAMGKRKARERKIRDLEKEAYGSGETPSKSITHMASRKSGPAVAAAKKWLAQMREMNGIEMSDDED